MYDISVIVPVYNVEKYLKKCVDSIINQSFKNFELILVDDGSIDGSPSICDEYSKKDKRVKVVHQKNSGLSASRNKGVQIANGKYLLFIDSDDYINLDYLEKVFSLANSNNYDIVISGKYYEDENYQVFKQTGISNKGNISKEELLRKILLFDDIDTSFCDKLFLRKLFVDVTFPNGKCYEDLATLYKIIEKGNLFYMMGEANYHYILRNGSITNSKFGNKNFDMLDFSYELYNYINKNYKVLKPEADIFLCFQLSRILQDLYLYDKDKKYKDLKKKYKSQYNELFKKNIFNSKIKFKKKILLLLIYLNMQEIVFVFKNR